MTVLAKMPALLDPSHPYNTLDNLSGRSGGHTHEITGWGVIGIVAFVIAIMLLSILSDTMDNRRRRIAKEKEDKK